MSISRLALCTSNVGKAAEIGRILGLDIDRITLELDELQAIDPAAVSRHKAAQAYRLHGAPVIVDDTGLSLSALGGFPGALVAWTLSAGGPSILHRMLPAGASPAATAITTIGYADGDGVEAFTGRVAGQIVAEPRGQGGFGFDAVFVPDGATATFAEMSPEEKDRLSPRYLALMALKAYLAGRL